MESRELQVITGTVEDIIFHNEDSGFTVLLLDDGEEMQTVVGEILDLDVGEELKITGFFTSHPTYGSQFKASVFERKLPGSSVAILKYLSSGSIRGIGPALAKRLVEAFGEKTLEIMEKDPDQLTKVKGITPQKAREIREEFQRMFGVRTVMLFLSQHGIDPAASIRVWKSWGTAAPDLIQENPYLLCSDAVGLSFEKADEIAENFGLGREDPHRIRAGILFVLQHNLSNGHTCLPYNALVKTASALLSVEFSLTEEGIASLTERQELVSDTIRHQQYIYLPLFYQAEAYIAGRLAMMLQLNPPFGGEFSTEIGLLEQQNGVTYAEGQREAIREALSQHVMILTGGPGTGKTTTVNAMIELFEQQGLKVALAAPTGRAAKRMSEVTGKEAKTIHRLLEVDFKDGQSRSNRFKRNEKNPIPADVVIVDEMSMVDVLLFESLVRALKLSAKLIMVGDSDQLPSVGAGNVLKDLVDSGMVKTVCLEEIFRQAAESLIVTNAHAIIRGEMPELRIKNNDFFFLPSGNYEKTAQLVEDLCKTRLPKSYHFSPLWDIQVMTPNRVGEIGTMELNVRLQQALNPPSKEKKEFRNGAFLFREGDKVMQIKNNYDIPWVRENGEQGTGVYNGDIGIITLIDKPSHLFVVKYEDRTVTYRLENGDELELAYAVTVHKSQGCEFEAVVIPLMNHHPKLYHRNLFYTAVTRAKKLLILIGKAAAIEGMVQNSRKTRRYTNLAPFLRDAMGEEEGSQTILKVQPE